MPSIDLKEKRTLLVRREDIINSIRTNITDGEILEDIIDNVERQIVERCADLARVSVPFLGSFIPNEGKLDAIEHQAMMKANRDVMSEEEYAKFRYDFLKSRYKIRKGFRSKTIVINRTIRLNKAHARRMIKRYPNNRYFRLYFYFFAYMGPVKPVEYYGNVIDYD